MQQTIFRRCDGLSCGRSALGCDLDCVATHPLPRALFFYSFAVCGCSCSRAEVVHGDMCRETGRHAVKHYSHPTRPCEVAPKRPYTTANFVTRFAKVCCFGSPDYASNCVTYWSGCHRKVGSKMVPSFGDSFNNPPFVTLSRSSQNGSHVGPQRDPLLTSTLGANQAADSMAQSWQATQVFMG